mmetsp:Transcript_3055/g.8298  ORF Transcript_3055/g.8298 Transcript_3055/m.8298 type:complete len:497 (+) Transcript_3055:56-1546(+)
MKKTAPRVRENLSLLLFTLFLFNDLLASSDGSSSPDGRLPPSSTPAHFPKSSILNVNEKAAKSSIEQSFGNVTAVTAGDTIAESNIPLWKQQLPFPLNNKTKTLRRIVFPGDRYNIGSDVEVFLLGTAHISKDSSRDVHQLLESVKPHAIFLELCHQRVNMLEPEHEGDIGNDHQNIDEDKDDDSEDEKLIPISGFWNQCRGLFRLGPTFRTQKAKRGNEKRIDTRSFSSIASSLLTNMQDDYADSLGVELGGEFCAAYQYWKNIVPRGNESYPRTDRINDVHMILGDRPVTLTLTRAWESLRVWGKLKLMAGLIISSLRKPKPDELREWMEKILYEDTDLMSESVTELAKHFPTLAEVILKERDAYMACKLHQTCRGLLMADGRHGMRRRIRLVAIVGAGHVEGICQWLTTGGSLATTSKMKSTVASPPTTTASKAAIIKTTEDVSQEQPKSPEDILSKLIQIKSTISKEDHDYLVYQITEIDPELDLVEVEESN